MKSFRSQVISTAQSLGMKKREAEILYREMLFLMQDALISKGFLMLRNFGTFKIKKIKARNITSKIINNGRPTAIKAKRGIRFKASNNLKRKLNR